jgi:hypothetical protein
MINIYKKSVTINKILLEDDEKRSAEMLEKLKQIDVETKIDNVLIKELNGFVEYSNIFAIINPIHLYELLKTDVNGLTEFIEYVLLKHYGIDVEEHYVE